MGGTTYSLLYSGDDRCYGLESQATVDAKTAAMTHTYRHSRRREVRSVGLLACSATKDLIMIKALCEF